MKFRTVIHGMAVCASMAIAGSAFAHIVLQDGTAPAGASYRATFKVGHGCDGAATTGIAVTIPPGFVGAQPMPKAGWTLHVVSGKLEQPYESHGKKFTEGALEIRWTASTPADALPNDFYDEFVLRGTTPTKPGPLWFKVVQTCTQGSAAWVEVPDSGNSTKGLKAPAALLEVLDVPATGEHHH